MDVVFQCKYCKKKYSSCSSRSNHIKRIHKKPSEIVNKNVNSDVNTNVDIFHQNFNCKKCNKSFTTRQSKSRHENHYCKEDNNINEKIDYLVETVNKLKKENELMKNKSKLLQKINNNTNNGTITNNVINHININALGCESINEKLTENEKIDLLTSPLFKEIPYVELIRKIYNNEKFLEDRNIMITNLQNKSCLVYNNETKKFEAKNKSDHIDSLIDYRQKDIKNLFEDMQDNNKIKSNTKKLIEDYIDQFDNLKNTESYKKYKEEIIYIIYNCKEIMKKLKDDLEINDDDSISI